jgi:hypothetical protein
VHVPRWNISCSIQRRAAVFSLIPAAIPHALEFDMSELISSLRSQDHGAIFESLQTHLREAAAARQTDTVPSPAVKTRVRPGVTMLDETEAAASMSQVQAEAQNAADMAAVHSGLDPQRVAKLLALLE